MRGFEGCWIRGFYLDSREPGNAGEADPGAKAVDSGSLGLVEREYLQNRGQMANYTSFRTKPHPWIPRQRRGAGTLLAGHHLSAADTKRTCVRNERCPRGMLRRGVTSPLVTVKWTCPSPRNRSAGLEVDASSSGGTGELYQFEARIICCLV